MPKELQPMGKIGRRVGLAAALLLANGLLAQGAPAQPIPLGPETQVNTYTTSMQVFPDVATDPLGNAVVVWQSLGSSGTDPQGFSIQGQRLDAVGAPIGGEFQVNSYTLNSQYRPSVAVWPDGSFVVVWESYGSAGTDTSRRSIQAQRFAANATSSS